LRAPGKKCVPLEGDAQREVSRGPAVFKGMLFFGPITRLNPFCAEPPAAMPAAWDQLWNQSRVPIKPSSTPDTYLYDTFDFRGWVGRVWLNYAQ
jgi:hypothetical protein